MVLSKEQCTVLVANPQQLHDLLKYNKFDAVQLHLQRIIIGKSKKHAWQNALILVPRSFLVVNDGSASADEVNELKANLQKQLKVNEIWGVHPSEGIYYSPENAISTLPNFEVKIVDAAGKTVAPENFGTLFVKG